jgi:hypothetical protein
MVQKDPALTNNVSPSNSVESEVNNTSQSHSLTMDASRPPGVGLHPIVTMSFTICMLSENSVIEEQ